MWLLRPRSATVVARAPEPGRAPGRRAERRRCLARIPVPTPGGSRTALDLDPGRPRARLRRPPGRRAATLRAAARRGRGTPARRHRGRAGAGGVAGRPVGGVLGARSDQEGTARPAAPSTELASGTWTRDRLDSLGTPTRRLVLRPERRPHLEDPGERGACGGDDVGRRRSIPRPAPAAARTGRSLLYTVRKRFWSWGDEQIVARRSRQERARCC